MYRGIIIDTETTDTKDPEVIEMAWREFPQTNGEPAAFRVWRFKPEKEIALGALATHHILDEELEGCVPSSNAKEFVPEAEFWIGHNVDFDWKVLGSPPVKRICTLAICRAVWPGIDSHSLVAMMYHLMGRTRETREAVQGAHGALADVGMCIPILNYVMAARNLLTLESLWSFSEECRIPKIMSFGKWKDYKVSEVDKGYAAWYDRESRKTGDRDEYLIEAFKRAGKL